MTNSKEKIIQRTIDIIAEKGFNGPISNISKEVGCSDTLIYRYFGTRDKLLDVCFHRVCESILADIHQVPIPQSLNKESFENYLHELWKRYVTSIIANPKIASYYIQYVWFNGPRPSGYLDSQDIFFRIVGKENKKNFSISPEMVSLFDYILYSANSLAIAIIKGWIKVDEDFPEKSYNLLMNGIKTELNQSMGDRKVG